MEDNETTQKSGVPKLFEIYRRQRQDSETSMSDCPEIDFTYADSDSYENEIAELYSYSEGPEFQLNIKAFESVCSEAKVLALWQSMTEQKHFSLLTRVTDQMELCDSAARATASRAMLYIAQGCWGEVQSDQEQVGWVRRNCFTLLRCNAWASCIQLLNMEIEAWVSSDSNASGSNKQQQQQPGSHMTVSTSSQVRVLLSILYTMVETLRWPSQADTEEERQLRAAFCADLALPQEETEELLAVTLLGMVTRFCNSSPPHFPIRKLLLLLWKVILVTLGGTDALWALKCEYRVRANLSCPGPEEDTVSVCRGLRPASPPAPATDLLDQQQQQQHNMVRRRPFRRQSLMKQSSLDDSMGDLDLAGEDDAGGAGGGAGSAVRNGADGGGSGDNSDSGIGEDETSSGEASPDGPLDEREMRGEEDPIDTPGSPRPLTPALPHTPVPPPPPNKGLPWAPKVRQKDIDNFLDVSREKFVGFQLVGDRTTLAGLPPPIHEGVHTLSKHIYTSLSEVQMKREEEVNRNPLSRPEKDVLQTPAEVLYQCLLPTLPQCMIALLKVLLAAAPTSKAKTDSINIMADVLPEEMPLTVVQSMKLGLDVNRHKEILVKAVSATLLLLLKHLKLNHVYQFEFMSQHLVFANCIPLILKFFNQNIMAYVRTKNTIALLDFPSCVIGDGADLSNDALLASIGAAAGGALESHEGKSFDGASNSNLLSSDSSTLSSNPPSTPSSSSNNNNNNNNNNNGNGGGAAGGGSSNLAETSAACCWRNMFSCINLLRVLNKLCKWKHSRIMMLVVFKSAPILKRTLMVKHAMMQLYVLKLLKMQTKYLGRQWRKSNMKTLSAIYQMVRHRLNDDWAYGNDPDARPWDFQTEECSLRAAVDRFNTRRYHHAQTGDSEFEPVDNCITSVLGRHVELTEEFTRSYEVWLQREVLDTTIHWDLLLSTNTNAVDTSASSKKSSCEKCRVTAKSGQSTEASSEAQKLAKSEGCECGKKLVLVGASGDYTPLIQQLSGQFYRHHDESRPAHGRVESPDEDEYDKKERMQTMIKKTSTGLNGTAAAIVDIPIDDDGGSAEDGGGKGSSKVKTDGKQADKV